MKETISNIITRLNLITFKEILLIRLGLRTKLYEQRTSIISNLYKDIVKPGMLVYDVGANMGHYTSAFLKLGAEVICVEPQSGCFKILKTRYKNDKRVQLLHCALDSEEGEKKIHISNMSTISSMSEEWINAVKTSKRFPGAEWEKEVRVKTNTLESLMAAYGRPDFIKIDVEGYELNVLKGLKSKVPLISIEYTFEVTGTTIKCLEYLEGIGKTVVLLNDTYADSKWISSKDAITALHGITDKDSTGDLFIKFI